MAARVLMCPPDYYGIEYEINPWMRTADAADHPAAIAQWQTLRDTLSGLGAIVLTMPPQPGLPDLVFTANAGLIYRDTFLSSRFKHEVRAKESPHFEAWMAANGFIVEQLPEGLVS